MGIVVERAEEYSPPPEPATVTPLPLVRSHVLGNTYSIPTHRVQSANVQESRPEIGGSFGGFVGLIVGLCALFLISCIGIFILLRNHEPTSYERHMRRSRARQRDFTTEVPIGPPGIRERFARLFGRRTGWIKASGGDGDEWDASEDPAPYKPHTANELRERERGDVGYPASLASSAGPHATVAPDASTESVEVELRAPPGPASSQPSFFPDPPPRTDGVREEHRSMDRHTPVPLHESPPLTASPGVHGENTSRDDRKFSVQIASSTADSVSIHSMRKFDNGTKFKEGLTF